MPGHPENVPYRLSHPASRRSSLLHMEHRLAGVKVGLIFWPLQDLEKPVHKGWKRMIYLNNLLSWS
jgi:hypothetical protein